MLVSSCPEFTKDLDITIADKQCVFNFQSSKANQFTSLRVKMLAKPQRHHLNDIIHTTAVNFSNERAPDQWKKTDQQN